MARSIFLNPTHWLKPGSYLAVMMFASAIWILLDLQSPAQGAQAKLRVKPILVVTADHLPHLASGLKLMSHQLLAQNIESIASKSDISKDLSLQNITITQDSNDKSLLTVKGFINNRSEQTRYVYYVVAKFIANDTSIKQTIIPVNIDIQPGKSQAFTHEISTDSVNTIELETVKPLVVKYEYR
jgi:hypothetical protein